MTDQPAFVSKCELCGNNCQSEPCVYCRTMSREELIEQAHETISGWKRLMIAAVIANGGQTAILPQQMLEAETRKIKMETPTTLWNGIRITVH